MLSIRLHGEEAGSRGLSRAVLRRTCPSSSAPMLRVPQHGSIFLIQYFDVSGCPDYFEKRSVRCKTNQGYLNLAHKLMKTIKLDLTTAEKQCLRQNKIKINALADYAPDEISALLNTNKQRAKALFASIGFQAIPSIGPKFANDLMLLGYYSIGDLVGKDASDLFDELERKQGFWTDPCVEDQFRLVVHYANHRGSNKNWWDFTAERKEFRAKHGYPADRPKTAWTDVYQVLSR